MKPEEDYDGLFGEGTLGNLQGWHYKLSVILTVETLSLLYDYLPCILAFMVFQPMITSGWNINKMLWNIIWFSTLAHPSDSLYLPHSRNGFGIYSRIQTHRTPPRLWPSFPASSWWRPPSRSYSRRFQCFKSGWGRNRHEIAETNFVLDIWNLNCKPSEGGRPWGGAPLLRRGRGGLRRLVLLRVLDPVRGGAAEMEICEGHHERLRPPGNHALLPIADTLAGQLHIWTWSVRSQNVGKVLWFNVVWAL